MATVALQPPRIRVSARSLELAPLILGLVGLGLGWAGSTWDVAWHRALGRDTFWSPPHLAMYIGTTLVGISSLVAIATAVRGRQTRSLELAIGPLHVERSLALVGFGALTIISAAPLDDLRHLRVRAELLLRVRLVARGGPLSGPRLRHDPLRARGRRDTAPAAFRRDGRGAGVHGAQRRGLPRAVGGPLAAGRVRAVRRRGGARRGSRSHTGAIAARCGRGLRRCVHPRGRAAPGAHRTRAVGSCAQRSAGGTPRDAVLGHSRVASVAVGVADARARLGRSG